MPEKQQKPIEEIAQLVIFRLRDEEFGVDIATVMEIIRVLDITHIPEAPLFIKGVINLRGQIVPVIDLASQFELEPEENLPAKSRIVISEICGQTVGLLVDEASEVIKIPVENIEPAPELIQSRIKRDYIKGVAKLKNRLIILLDLDKVLAPEEIKEVVRTESEK